MFGKDPITPRTRIGDMLKSYPHLEPLLLEMSPAFEKLKNPVLRLTVAKVATLEQIARIGRLSLAETINRLRRAAGIAEGFSENESAAGAVTASAPPWFAPERIAGRLDGRPLLEAGEQPIIRVLAELDKLEAGEIFELTMPFPPLPLIETAHAKGFQSWTKEESPELAKTYFVKK